MRDSLKRQSPSNEGWGGLENGNRDIREGSW